MFKHTISLFLILILLFNSFRNVDAQNIKEKRVDATFTSDTGKINSLLKSANDYLVKEKFEKAISITKTVQILSRNIHYVKGSVLALTIEGTAFDYEIKYDSALIRFENALLLFQKLNDSTLQSDLLFRIGSDYARMESNSLAVEYFYKGLVIEEKLKVKNNLQWYYSNLATVLSIQKNYAQSLLLAEEGLNLARKTNIRAISALSATKGWSYLQLKKNDSALYTFDQALKFSEMDKDEYMITLSLENMAEIETNLKHYGKAYEYCTRSYELAKRKNYKDQIACCLMCMGRLAMIEKKFKEAEKYMKEAVLISQEIQAKDLTKDAALLLAEFFDKKKDFKNAFQYYKIYNTAKDTLLNRENIRLMAEMNTKYTTVKKEKEIELLKKNEDIQNLELAKNKNELDRQRTVSISVFVGFLLLMTVAILTFSRYRLKKRANDELQKAFNLIEEKNTLIEKSNLMITDSITYAKRIQDAILPAQEELTKIFHTNFFILYQPAQIVSGDFYWCSQQQNKTIFVVADCTGHGVPGAFMSMIGNTLLNEIVNERKVTDTKKIAELLDEKIIHSLHQHTGTDNYDGMDISICCIDNLAKEIHFTGAHHAMYTYNGHLEKVKGDPYSIGGAQQQKAKTFSSKRLPYEKGLSLYFLTDGYCDQSGGEANKRFSTRQFEILLTAIQNFSMNDQKEKLEFAMKNWKDATKQQRDDILVVGIKLKTIAL